MGFRKMLIFRPLIILTLLIVVTVPSNTHAGAIGAVKCLIGFCEHTITKVTEYVGFLRGDDLFMENNATVLSFNCEALREDYTSFLSSLVDDTGTVTVDYYKKEKYLAFRRPLGTITDREFIEQVESVREYINNGMRPRLRIQEEYLLFGAMVRLFDEYEVLIGRHSHVFDLTMNDKCK